MTRLFPLLRNLPLSRKRKHVHRRQWRRSNHDGGSKETNRWMCIGGANSNQLHPKHEPHRLSKGCAGVRVNQDILMCVRYFELPIAPDMEHPRFYRIGGCPPFIPNGAFTCLSSGTFVLSIPSRYSRSSHWLEVLVVEHLLQGLDCVSECWTG